MDCKDMGDLTESFGGIELLRCFNRAGNGWDVVGSTESPPEPITFSLEGLLSETRDWLEKIKCPFSLYVLNRDCGRADVFSNYVRGEILSNCRIAQRTYSGLVMREEDTPATLGIDIEAWPPLIDVSPLTVDRMTTALALSWNDIYGNPDLRCDATCDAPIEEGEELVVGSDSAPAAATADVPYSNDSGVTWAAAAADPFGAGFHVMAAVRFPIGVTGVRWLVGREGTGAVQGQMAYSDNVGGAWTVVSIGGAAVGHGPTYGGGLWESGENFVLCASADGYIYKSIDGGGSWVAKEAGTITVGDYKQVKATSDNVYCIAGALADVIALSDDGGESWYAASATGGGGDILTCWRFNKNDMMVGTDDGTLYSSDDGGTTWTLITGWTGAGAGDVRDLWFVDAHVGFMAYNTIAPLGDVKRTINGGVSWENLVTPTNSGVNKVWAPNGRLAYVVGELNGGTSFVAKVTAA
jgi:photosystem II stability/assembly factor-like uncharacterized protein